MTRTVFVTLLAGTLICGTLAAQTESGPKTGSKIAEFEVLVAAGDDAGKKVDVIKQHKDKMVVVIFVQGEKFDRPMARFLKELDKQMENRKGIAVAAVWLTDDVDNAKDRLPKIQQSIQLAQTAWTVFPGQKTGPNGWDINSDAHMTVVIADKGKVAVSTGYLSVNETDVRGVLQKLPKK
jgi:ribosomal protein L24